jgi:HEAT repeat protein
MSTSPTTALPGAAVDLPPSSGHVATVGDARPTDPIGARPRPDAYPYRFVDDATARPSRYVPSLLETLRSDVSAPARLVAAWTLGAIGRRSTLPALRTAYAAEPEPNVRSNIAWAMLRCVPWRPSRRDVEVLLDDPYDAVVLIALKAVSLVGARIRRDPLQLYAAHANIVVRATILDQLHRFAIDRTQVTRFLEDTLADESRPWLRAAALRALSRAEPARAASLALDLARSARTPLEQALMRHAFLDAATSAGESRWCPELSRLYGEFDDPARRWDAITATVAAGGPAATTALAEMEVTEADEVVRAMLRELKDALVVTVAAEAARSMAASHDRPSGVAAAPAGPSER